LRSSSILYSKLS